MNPSSRARAVRMFEANYSYSVIAKKLNKGWVSKWTRRWKTNPAESLQSQTNRTALGLSNCTKNYSQKQISDITFYQKNGLQIRQICRHNVCNFYRAMLCIRGTSHGPVSVCFCLSVCLSQAGVLLKRQNVGSHKQHHTILQEL